MYSMSTTIQKILLHFLGIIKRVTLPMGQRSVEAQESRKRITFHAVLRFQPFSINYISRINCKASKSRETCLILPTMFSDLRSMFQNDRETNIYTLFEHADKNVQRSVRLLII
jgi:hypothetical protein